MSTSRKTSKEGRAAAVSGRTYVSKGLSIHPALYESARARADELGMKFSEYVVHCVRRDLSAEDGEFVIRPLRKGKSAEPRGDKW